MQIRSAVVADAPGIASVHVSSWRAIYRGHMPPQVLDSLDVNERSRLWHSLLERASHDTLIAEHQGVRGFCHLAPSRDADAPPGTGEITALYVEPTSWRNGLGSQLLAAAVARARERDFHLLILWVLRENDRARAFYEATGFRPDGSERIDRALIGSPLHEVRYTRVLSSQAV